MKDSIVISNYNFTFRWSTICLLMLHGAHVPWRKGLNSTCSRSMLLGVRERCYFEWWFYLQLHLFLTVMENLILIIIYILSCLLNYIGRQSLFIVWSVLKLLHEATWSIMLIEKHWVFWAKSINHIPVITEREQSYWDRTSLSSNHKFSSTEICEHPWLLTANHTVLGELLSLYKISLVIACYKECSNPFIKSTILRMLLIFKTHCQMDLEY